MRIKVVSIFLLFVFIVNSFSKKLEKPAWEETYKSYEWFTFVKNRKIYQSNTRLTGQRYTPVYFKKRRRYIELELDNPKSLHCYVKSIENFDTLSSVDDAAKILFDYLYLYNPRLKTFKYEIVNQNEYRVFIENYRFYGLESIRPEAELIAIDCIFSNKGKIVDLTMAKSEKIPYVYKELEKELLDTKELFYKLMKLKNPYKNSSTTPRCPCRLALIAMQLIS